ncbi:MAG: hypothetical protein ACE5Z5_06160 [Candidatus Bathyarchaeia archaeon]
MFITVRRGRSTPGFKAWIDRVSLSVYYDNKTNDPAYGEAALPA